MRIGLKHIGTTALVSAIMIGPGTISSVLNAGSLYGVRLLWAVLLSAIVLTTVAYLVGKVTIVTGLTTFELMDRHVLRGLGKVVAYVQVPTHVAVITAAAATLAHVGGMIFHVSNQLVILSLLAAVSLALWIWAGGFRWLRRLTTGLVLAMAAVFAALVVSMRWDPGAVAQGLVPSLPGGGSEGLLVTMGIVGGASGSAVLLILPYQVKASRLGTADIRRLAWDAVIFMGVAFGVVSLAVMGVGAAISQGEGIRNATRAFGLLATHWNPAVGWIFLLGLFAAVWTSACGPCYTPPLLLADVMDWRGPDGARIVEADPHKDTRFRVVASLTMLSWLLCPVVARWMEPFHLLMLSLGVLNLSVPLLVGVFVYAGSSRRIMGEHTVGWPVRALGSLAFVFSWWGVVNFVRFLVGFLI